MQLINLIQSFYKIIKKKKKMSMAIMEITGTIMMMNMEMRKKQDTKDHY
jgi:hypothetical protein